MLRPAVTRSQYESRTLRFGLARERCRSDVQDHKAGMQARLGDEECRQPTQLRIYHLLDAAFGDARERRNRNRQLVGLHREWLAVKVASAQDLRSLGKNRGVVGCGIHFHQKRRADLGDSVTHGTVVEEATRSDGKDARGVGPKRTFGKRRASTSSLSRID
jgi:hypothetical protein